MPRHRLHEVRAGELGQLGVRLGDDGRGPQLRSSAIAEEVARRQLARGGAVARDLDDAVGDHVEGIAALALAHDRRTRRDAPTLGAAGEVLDGGGGSGANNGNDRRSAASGAARSSIAASAGHDNAAATGSSAPTATSAARSPIRSMRNGAAIEPRATVTSVTLSIAANARAST